MTKRKATGRNPSTRAAAEAATGRNSRLAARATPTAAGATKTQGARLREARIAAGFGTASDAARKMGVAGPTYLAHENGTRTFRPDISAFYASEFGVSPSWLLLGEGAASPAVPLARAAVPVAHSDPVLLAYTGLMRALDLTYTDNGIVPVKDPDLVLPLPQVDANPYFVPEVCVSGRTKAERLVAILPGGQASQVLAVRSVVGVGASFGVPGHYFAFRPHPRDPLLARASRAQLIVCDADGLALIDAVETLALACIDGTLRTVIAAWNDDGRLTYRISASSSAMPVDPHSKAPLLGVLCVQIGEVSAAVQWDRGARNDGRSAA